MEDCFAPLGPPLLPWDLMAQTHKETHTQTDMATHRPTRPSAAELVKILIEDQKHNTIFKYIKLIIFIKLKQVLN